MVMNLKSPPQHFPAKMNRLLSSFSSRTRTGLDIGSTFHLKNFFCAEIIGLLVSKNEQKRLAAFETKVLGTFEIIGNLMNLFGNSKNGETKSLGH